MIKTNIVSSKNRYTNQVNQYEIPRFNEDLKYP